MSDFRSMRSPGNSTESNDPLLKVDGLKKYFDRSRNLLSEISFSGDRWFSISIDREKVRAVDDVSFEIQSGETLGLVGESGCGKSTLARTILRLIEPTDGDIHFKGQNLTDMGSQELRQTRSDIQMIFQDPQSSLDPRRKIGSAIVEPMKAHGMLDEEGREERARELLGTVGLDPQHFNRYPHEFSGGQRQRVNLARALSVDPDFIVCDEPVSALDVSIQAQVLNTISNLQDEFDLTYLFITHDLSVIRHISDRVAVMYMGELVELAHKEELFENPKHPYTEALLDSVPVPDPRDKGQRGILMGDVPSPVDPPSGCRFRTRCPKVIAPEQYQMTETEWRDVVDFMRAVRHQTLYSGVEETEVRDQFFNDGVPAGEAGEIVRDAIDDVTKERFDEAADLLQKSFAEPSICAKEDPECQVDPEYGRSAHVANCHLNRD